MMRFRNQKGFTLLEIMLVVLIIGIIALLALPRLLVTRQMARQHTCEGNQSAMRTHLEAYRWDWGIYPDPTKGIAQGEWYAFLNDTRYWPLGDPAPKYCPSGSEYNYYMPAGGSASGFGITEYNLYCPVADHNVAGGF